MNIKKKQEMQQKINNKTKNDFQFRFSPLRIISFFLATVIGLKSKAF